MSRYRFAPEALRSRVRDELKLNRADVGWYQVRKALNARNQYSDGSYDFNPFKAAFDALSAKLRPLVYEYGFLRI
jgi:hypothetical protein